MSASKNGKIAGIVSYCWYGERSLLFRGDGS